MTSTIEPKLAASTRVFPNPSQGLVRIAGDWIRPTERYRVEVRSVSGQQMQVVEQASYRSEALEIDLAPVPAGIYFIKVSTGPWNHVVKVVRQ